MSCKQQIAVYHIENTYVWNVEILPLAPLWFDVQLGYAIVSQFPFDLFK